MSPAGRNMYPEARPPDAPAPLATPERALAIGAHPDDIEFGAGATLAKWAAAGCEVTMLVLTDGSKGTWDPNLDPAALIAIRRVEQEKAAAQLGAQVVETWDHVDGELEATRELRAALCRFIRRARPGVVFTHDPWRRYEMHPDHRATGWAVVDAVVAARDHLFFPDQIAAGLEPHRPEALLLWKADEPDHHEDVTATLDAKVRALLCHRSQAETTMGDAGRDEAATAEFSERIAAWAARAGAPVGLTAAEAFKRLEP